MAKRTTNNLKHKELIAEIAKLRAAEQTGEWSDGGGLKLVLTPAGRARWVHKFQWQGRTRARMFPGCFPDEIGLAEARDLRDADRKLLRDRKDPIAEAKATTEVAKGVPSFAEYAREHAAYLAPKEARSRKTWERQMGLVETDGASVGALGKLPVDEVALADVKAVIEPLWASQPPTAKEVLGRIRRVLDHRFANTGQFERRNPAEFGLIERAIGQRYEHQTQHRAALDYADLPGFIATLRARPGLKARCLETAILTGCRINEITGLRWDEIDLRKRTITIPASRMKTQDDEVGEDHVIPLSLATVRVLRKVWRETPVACRRDLVFPNRKGRPLDDSDVVKIVHAIAGSGVASTHGFRSTITDWGTSVPHRARAAFSKDLMMAVIAHALGDQTDRAYLRSRWLEQRRAVMREWSRYLADAPIAEVIPFRRAA